MEAMTPYFSCIFARGSSNGGFGFKNKLPWNLPNDLKRFKKITMQGDKENIVIMGRKTWEGLDGPLKGRINIVVTSQELSDVNTASSLDDALTKAKSYGKGRSIFVIGGTGLLEEAFRHPFLEIIYETKIEDKDGEYDTFFNSPIPHTFYPRSSESDGDVTFLEHIKLNYTHEIGYLSLLYNVSTFGEKRGDRTGTGTISLFSPQQLEFDLMNCFPLLTTKFVSLRVVFEELIWMLRGQNNNNTLKKKNVHIWTKNSDDYHKRKIEQGEEHRDGDLGAIYGVNWRNFGGECISDVEDKRHIGEGGFDQIAYVINEIKNNPESRRILFTGWNPLMLDKTCLPACHFAAQFYVSHSIFNSDGTTSVSDNKYLDCKVMLRSNDLFLGAPFNIAQYSLLTYMIAAMTGCIPRRLVYSIGDAHIYSNHLDQVKEQWLRPIRNFPVLKVLNTPEKIEDFEFSDFELIDYNPHPTIKGEMAV